MSKNASEEGWGDGGKRERIWKVQVLALMAVPQATPKLLRYVEAVGNMWGGFVRMEMQHSRLALVLADPPSQQARHRSLGTNICTPLLNARLSDLFSLLLKFMLLGLQSKQICEGGICKVNVEESGFLLV
jgi:hypothetical protein